MSNLLNRLEKRKMPSEDVAICLDLSLLKEREAALTEVAVASRRAQNEDRMVMSDAVVKEARDRVADVEARIKDASITLRITGVDRTTYNRFYLACPPRKGRNETYDPTKFFMHVARETAKYVDEHGHEHDILPEEWAAIDKSITDGEHDRIAKAVVSVNREVGGSNIAFLGSVSATIPASSETSD